MRTSYSQYHRLCDECKTPNAAEILKNLKDNSKTRAHRFFVASNLHAKLPLRCVARKNRCNAQNEENNNEKTKESKKKNLP